jgi:hypothetical protein
MVNFWYVLRNRITNKRKARTFITGVADISDVPVEVLAFELQALQEKRLKEVLKGFKRFSGGDDTNPGTLEAFLPAVFKPFANNKHRLLEQMASWYEIDALYEVMDVSVAPNCEGCLHDEGGYKHHQRCPDGCLHYKELCYGCSPPT